MKKLFISFLIIMSCFFAYSQNSIYEFGRDIVTYEDNFKNFIQNWNERNVTNVKDYTLKDIEFVETISNAERYNYYRNYFTSEKLVGALTMGTNGYKDGKKFQEFTIRPSYIYEEIFDTRKLPEQAKEVFSPKLIEKYKEILTQDFNIDTLNLYSYNSHKQ